jgi:hypothetical protein
MALPAQVVYLPRLVYWNCVFSEAPYISAMKHLLPTLILCLIALSCSEPTPPAPTRADVLLSDARKRVRGSLLTPSTAAFVDSLNSVVRLNNGGEPSNSWRVIVYVDAQNRFGAMLRKRSLLVYEQTGPDSLLIADYRVKRYD